MANLADLAIAVSADVDGVTSGMDEAADAVEDFESTTSKVGSFVEENFLKIGAAAAGVGAGLEGFARSQQESNVAFERMGRVTGEGSQAMRDMATDLQNVTFPMSDVVDLMETASKRGLQGDAIAEYAQFWDMVGDATGEAGPALGKAGVALGLVGIAAGEEAEALDAFGYITDQTTGSIEGFLGFIEKTAGELGDATPNVNDMAGALGALEDQGYSSQRAQRELRTALSETDGDMVAALETLGVSKDAFDAQVQAVEGSSGAIEANAQALAESFTPMQRMSAELEKTMTKYGGLASAAGAVSAPLAGAGSAMMGVSMVAPKLVSKLGTVISTIGTKIAALGSWAAATVASGAKAAAAFAASTARMVASGAVWVAQTAAQGARAAASMAVTTGQFIAHYARLAAASMVNAVKMAASWVVAMGPVGWVIAGIVALVALIIANWDKVVGVTKAMAEKVAGWFRSARDWVVGTATDLRDKVVAFFGNLRDTVVGIASGVRDRVVEFFTGLKDGAIAQVTSLIRRVMEIRAQVIGFFAGARSWLIDAGKNIIRGLIDGIGRMARALSDKVSSVVSSIRNKLPFSPAKEGPLSGRGSPDRAGATLVKMIADGMGSEVDTLSRMAERAAMAAMPGLQTPGLPALGSHLPGVRSVGRGNVGPTIQVTGTMMDPEGVARAVEDALAQSGRRTGGRVVFGS